MSRLVHSALWCIEVREQAGQTRLGNVEKTTHQLSQLKLRPHSQQLQPKGQAPGMRNTPGGRSPKKPSYSSKVANGVPAQGKVSPRKVAQTQQQIWVTQQQTNIFQIVTPPKQASYSSSGKYKSSVAGTSAMQLFAQEQRAEIYQHFYSATK